MTARARHHPDHGHERRRRRARRAPRVAVGAALVAVAITVGAIAAGMDGGERPWAWLAATVLLTAGSAVICTGNRRPRQPRTEPATPDLLPRPAPPATRPAHPASSALSSPWTEFSAARQDQTTEDARQLVAECEEVLSGRYAEYLAQHGRRVPAWAWANQLAHGTVDELHDAQYHPAVPSHSHWRDARAFLAEEVLDLVQHDAHTLGELQHDVLIPLELELASGHNSEPTSASAFTFAFLDTLDTHCT